jgi:predicted transposase/invertase (TIGR01784 family)
MLTVAMPPKYLDPKADVVFKKIFGEHPHLLKSFLNAILPLPQDGLIVDLEYLSPEHVPSIPTFKRTIVDVKCRDQQGRLFIVEMQVEWVTGFKQRMLFNASSAYVRQLGKREKYESLCPVYGLGLLNDIFDQENEAWYHHYQFVNVINPKCKLEGLELQRVDNQNLANTILLGCLAASAKSQSSDS